MALAGYSGVELFSVMYCYPVHMCRRGTKWSVRPSVVVVLSCCLSRQNIRYRVLDVWNSKAEKLNDNDCQTDMHKKRHCQTWTRIIQGSVSTCTHKVDCQILPEKLVDHGNFVLLHTIMVWTIRMHCVFDNCCGEGWQIFQAKFDNQLYVCMWQLFWTIWQLMWTNLTIVSD